MEGGCAVFSQSRKREHFANKSRSFCPSGRGSLVADRAGWTLVHETVAEEETGAETDAETVTISETGGVEIVEGADETALGVLGMIKWERAAIKKQRNNCKKIS